MNEAGGGGGVPPANVLQAYLEWDEDNDSVDHEGNMRIWWVCVPYTNLAV